MQDKKLTIGIDSSVIVTDQQGNSREGKVINHDQGANKYVVRFPSTAMGEFWSPEFVKAK
jgi:hypothetical protein